MRLGYQKPLDVDDLYHVQEQDASQALGDRIQK